MPVMSTRHLVAGSLVCSVSLVTEGDTFGTAAVSPLEQIACAQLMTLALPDVKVTEAVAVPAAATGPLPVAHCRVNGVVGKEIRFSLLPGRWN
jgi:hypothetical protein